MRSKAQRKNFPGQYEPAPYARTPYCHCACMVWYMAVAVVDLAVLTGQVHFPRHNHNPMARRQGGKDGTAAFVERT